MKPTSTFLSTNINEQVKTTHIHTMSVETIPFPFSSDVSKPVICNDEAEIEQLLQEYARKSNNNASYTRSSGADELPFFQCTPCLERAAYLRGLRDVEEICDRQSIDDECISDDLADLLPLGTIDVHSFTLWTSPCDEQRVQVFLKTLQETHGCAKNTWRESEEKDVGDDVLHTVARAIGEKIKREFSEVKDFGQDEIDAIRDLEAILVKITKNKPVDLRAELNLLVDNTEVACRDMIDKIDDVIKYGTYDDSDDVVRERYEGVYDGIDQLMTKKLYSQRYRDIADRSEWIERLQQLMDDLKKSFVNYEQCYDAYCAENQ